MESLDDPYIAHWDHEPTKGSPSPLNGERAGVRRETVRLVFRFIASSIYNFPRWRLAFYCSGMHWRNIALIGVGLLGGSLGLAIKQRRLANRVDGYVRRAASVSECETLGVLDRATTDLATAVQEAELVILCTPLSQMRELAERMAGLLKRGTLVTDVGSVKRPVVEQLEPISDGWRGENRRRRRPR